MAVATNCGSRFVAVDASCGCALTRATITGMTPSVFEAQGSREVYFDRVITDAQEGAISGYKEKFLESLLNSKMTPIKGQLQERKVENQSIILPYIYRRQKRIINSNYWAVVSGSATPGAGSNGLHPGDWDLILTNNSSRYGTTLTAIERYFLPGRYVLVETVNGTTKTAYAPVFKVVAAVNSDAAGVYRTTVTLEPNYSASGWNSLTAALKLPWQPTAGLAITLANSVSDYESWCNNDPSENNNKLLTFFLQTTRETHCINSEYIKAMDAAYTSGYWKEFRMLPLVEQRRQQMALAYKAWLNSAFFGQRINEFQDPDTYTSLPTVRDPLNTDCVLEYKANAIGFEQQLIDCGRYLDLQGGSLDMMALFEISYDLKRAREASGGTIDRIEWMTNRTNAGRIFTAMTSFFRTYYGTDIIRYYTPNQKLTFENQVALNYDVYEVPAEFGGFELVIIHDDYFSDKILAAGSDADQKNRQRVMWALDWSDIQVGVANSSSVQRKTPHPDVDSLYKCIIKNTDNTYLLKSKTWTAILQDPLRHYVIKNFDGGCPLIVANPCTAGN